MIKKKKLTTDEISNEYTVVELRAILKENGLSTSGKKKDLVERVLPILNGDLEEIEAIEVEDSNSADEVDLAPLVNGESVSSVLGIFGVSYDDLAIKDKIVMGDNASLNIEGFTQDGLSMSDATMSIVAASDSSSVDLRMNIPEVSYTDFESTVFTFSNLELYILPSSDPQSLEFSAVLDSLEIVTDRDYVNLKDLELFFKSFPDNGICMNINIGSFIYPSFNDTTFSFEDLDFTLAIGLDEEMLDISVDLPKLHLINKNYRVNLSDLELNVALHDLILSELDLSILMSDFHYTNFDDINVDMGDLDVSLEPISNSNSFDVNIGMSSFNLTGINSFEELFPMLNIDSISFKNFTSDSKLPVNMTGHISPLDVSQLNLVALGSLLSSGFDLETYERNMSGLYTLDEDADVSGFSVAGLDLGSIFEDFDYSSLDSIVLNLSGLIDSIGIDLSGFGIDMSGHDLSEISVAELIDVFKDSGVTLSSIQSLLGIFDQNLSELDLSDVIAKFDTENFDISALLGGINLSNEEISDILELLNDPEFDLGKVFENIDYSCFDAIKINLTDLIDSLGIDLSAFDDIFAALGIDLSGYDLSDITVSDLIDIYKNSNIDMSAITAVLKLIGIDLDELDFSGLVASFDADNFDLSTLLASLNLSDVDLSGILEMLNDPELGLAGIFENIDFSCLSAIELDLTGVIATLGIDLSVLGIDFSDYNPAAIAMSDLIDIFRNSDIDMSEMLSDFDLSEFDFENLDLSGLIASFDEENFDMTSLMASLDLSGLDVSAIADMLSNSEFDFASVFENVDLSCLSAIELNLTGLIVSTGIDLSALEGIFAGFGIDLSDYDLSAISLSELIGIVQNLNIDMSTVTTLLKLVGIDLSDLDLSGLLASFDEENFDMSSLMASLDLSGIDFSRMAEAFSNLELDFAAIFENFDMSSLDAIVIDLAGLIDTLGINLTELEGLLSDLGIDLSGYDLSAISVSEIIGIFTNAGFDMSVFDSMLNIFSFDFDDLDFSGFIVSYDLDELDIEGLLTSLNVEGVDIPGILAMFEMYGFDLTEFLNQLLSSFMAEPSPEITGDDE